MSCTLTRMLSTGALHAAFEHVADVEFAPDLRHIAGLAFVGEGRVEGDDEGAGNAQEVGVVKLSVTPSTKYSCSGSPPMLAKGRTTMERRGGLGDRSASRWCPMGRLLRSAAA